MDLVLWSKNDGLHIPKFNDRRLSEVVSADPSRPSKKNSYSTQNTCFGSKSL